jgi:hypothetical protein
MGSKHQSDFIQLLNAVPMATPAELMKTVNDATGVPLPTVVDVDRRLVKGGLRTKRGRGLSAAQMTPLDAASLLTAILASSHANASVEAVERYAQTQVDKRRSSEGLFAGIELDDLGKLPARHSFVEGLSALIASATTGSLAQLMRTKPKGQRPHIEVFAFTRATYGRIRISRLPSGTTASVEYLVPSAKSGKRSAKVSDQSLSAVSTGDLEQSRRITERTILAIATLLREEK